MIEGELRRLQDRIDHLRTKVIPLLESRTEALYALILPLRQGTEERETLESEYTLHSKELRLRCDEVITIKQEIARLESQRQSARKNPLLGRFR